MSECLDKDCSPILFCSQMWERISANINTRFSLCPCSSASLWNAWGSEKQTSVSTSKKKQKTKHLEGWEKLKPKKEIQKKINQSFMGIFKMVDHIPYHLSTSTVFTHIQDLAVLKTSWHNFQWRNCFDALLQDQALLQRLRDFTSAFRGD